MSQVRGDCHGCLPQFTYCSTFRFHFKAGKEMCSTSDNQGGRTIDDKFRESLLRSLNELRQACILCDVLIRVDKTLEFPAHRCVLAAGSVYFQALFSDDFRERKSGVVELEGIYGIEKVLEFLYTGKVEINESNAQDLVMAADYLNIPALKLHAAVALEKFINISNCLSLQRFSTKFDCALLKESCTFFTNQNYSMVTKSEAFKELSFEALIRLLKSDELNVHNEIEVLCSALSWIRYDLQSREKLLLEVLKHVRFPLIRKDYLINIVKSDVLLRSNAVEVNVLLKTIKQTSSASEKFRELHVPRTGPLETVVALTGGRSVSKYGSNNSVLAYIPLRDSWVTLSNLHIPRHGHSAAVCQGSLYLVGGVCRNVSAHSHVCRFSPLRNKWYCDVADLPHPVSFAAVVSLDEKLFVIGGKDCCNTALRRTQCYNREHNQWHFVADLNLPRDSHCATVLNDSIYVISGDKENFKSCERYDSTIMRWNLLPDMTMSRQQPAVHALRGKVLVVGGYAGSNYSMHTTCEIFDPKKFQWSLVPGLGVPRAGCGITCVADHVYVFGGSNGRSILNTLDSVECYNEEDKEWRKISVIPETIVAPQVAVFRMPRKYLT